MLSNKCLAHKKKRTTQSSEFDLKKRKLDLRMSLTYRKISSFRRLFSYFGQKFQSFKKLPDAGEFSVLVGG